MTSQKSFWGPSDFRDKESSSSKNQWPVRRTDQRAEIKKFRLSFEMGIHSSKRMNAVQWYKTEKAIENHGIKDPHGS